MLPHRWRHAFVRDAMTLLSKALMVWANVDIGRASAVQRSEELADQFTPAPTGTVGKLRPFQPFDALATSPCARHLTKSYDFMLRN